MWAVLDEVRSCYLLVVYDDIVYSTIVYVLLLLPTYYSHLAVRSGSACYLFGEKRKEDFLLSLRAINKIGFGARVGFMRAKHSSLYFSLHGRSFLVYIHMHHIKGGAIQSDHLEQKLNNAKQELNHFSHVWSTKKKVKHKHLKVTIEITQETKRKH